MALTKKSETITLVGSIEIPAAGTYTQDTINVPLSVTQQQVFVVQSVSFDCQNTEAITATDTGMFLQLTSTTQTGNIFQDNLNFMSGYDQQIITDGAAFMQYIDSENPSRSDLGGEPIGILFTDNLFFGGSSVNQTINHFARVRVTGYYAKADTATYVAGVASENSQ
tara:strand:- start:499 stop:999 length:501 start_codon:yes stop_codon:yes gene_type:complete